MHTTESKNPYPKLPDHLKKALGKGEYAMYRLLGVYDDAGRFRGRDHSIPSRDLIFDPKTETPYSIAYIVSLNPDGSPELGDIWFRADNQCQIVCHPGARDASAFQYLELTNYNASNPNRDPSVPAVFERVDTLKGAKEVREKRALKFKAAAVAQEMTDIEVLRYIQQNNPKYPQLKVKYLPDGTPDYIEMHNDLEDFAEREPHKFLAANDVTASSKTPITVLDVVKYARENKIIDLDRQTKQWFNVGSGKAFFKVKSTQGTNAEDELIEWLQGGNGKGIFEKMKVAMDQEKKEIKES